MEKQTSKHKVNYRQGFIILALLTPLLGCVATAPKLNLYNVAEVSQAISVKRDDFEKSSRFSGPNASIKPFDNVFIRAWKFDGSNALKYQIYVQDYYEGGWRFYSIAFDSNGVMLKTIVISRDVGSCTKYGCSYNEHIGIDVSESYLKENTRNGINFKLSGKSGEEFFFIPGAYIEAFLKVAK